MRHSRHLSSICLLLPLVTLACSDAQEPDVGTPSAELDTFPLTIGDRGSAISRTHEILRQYGYFPNEELARTMPGFTPMAAEPEDPNVFGDSLAVALRKYQRNMGLEPSGTLDASTWDALQQPRCGVTDLDPERDLGTVPKWALYVDKSRRWNKAPGAELKYFIDFKGCTSSCLGSFTNAQITKEIGDGVSKWDPWIDLTIRSVTSAASADFVIALESLDSQFDGNPGLGSPPGSAGSEVGPGPTLTFNRNADAWATAPLQYVEDVAAHEMGHVLGLQHSSTDTAQMHPFTGQQALRHEDKLAANLIYDGFGLSRDCCARDIDVNSVSGSDKLWMVSESGKPYEWLGGTWVNRTAGVVANRIAVCADNTAWIARANGAVSLYNGSSWVAQPALPSGTAKSIGCAEGGTTVWVVSSAGTVWRRSSSGWTERTGLTNAKEIDVDASGTPWVVTTNDQVWRHSSGTTWTRIDTNADAGRLDIAIGVSDDPATPAGPTNYVWVISSTLGVSILNYQTPIATPGGLPAPPRNLFEPTGRQQFGSRIAAGRGTPYIVDNDQEVWRRTLLNF